MKSLVTGGMGFIGSHLVKELRELGHVVICVDNANLPDDFHYDDSVNRVKGDIRDYALMKTLMEGVDYVFHLAAESKIGTCIDNPIQAASTNELGTCTLLQAARDNNVKRFIYSSTSAAYGGNECPNVETQPDDCLNPYSVSKSNGEKLCKMYNDLFGLKTVSFRYFNVYGERQPIRGQYAPVVGIFLRQRAAGEALTIVGDGEQRRDFTHVSDVVQANVLAATTEVDESAFGQLYNIGNGKNYSVNELAAMISDNTTNIPPRIGEARISLANNNKMKTTFGWNPQVKLSDWVAAQK